MMDGSPNREALQHWINSESSWPLRTPGRSRQRQTTSSNDWLSIWEIHHWAALLRRSPTVAFICGCRIVSHATTCDRRPSWQVRPIETTICGRCFTAEKPGYDELDGRAKS